MAVPGVVNYWPSTRCAKAFWGQHDLPPYRDLLTDTLDWAAPAAGEHWLDLGCGGGRVAGGLWERSGGALAAVTGVDCAAANAAAFARLRATLTPPPGDRLRFRCHDFSTGLDPFPTAAFDHAVSGLSISYAEHYDAAAGRWTTAAYDRLLAEVRRVVRPGGRFVFSVNVPDPAWAAVAWRSVPTLVGADRPVQRLKGAWRMMRYGRWLSAEARRGRFHYLPAATVADKLRAAGWAGVEYRLSYARQAFVFRTTNPG
ncbi:class I SAM-dependent methyltransferase [bacterium]|nr:class I SAM-dependent methyltransferase [bacterium]